MDGNCYETGVVKSKGGGKSYSNKWMLSSGKLLRENGPTGSSSERGNFPLLSHSFPEPVCKFRRGDIGPR